ncbi:FecR family protein [Croceicoccus bisphenolivorans]|uniref:FecR family protein n=1 Tax=Croceicoccus bisphenolivorans TaxID=1783232 RepID=UPI00082B263E|nr:FecR domain-containing protein [Croceicoccus bisphenolivorans]
MAQSVEVGNAATVVGDVRMSNAQIKKPREIERKQRIAWGDLIDTGKRSQLQILLLDRSTFGIGAQSRVQIDKFVYDPNAGRSVFASFIKGALRFFSGRQADGNNAEIRTPAGRIGIRGTALDLLVGKQAQTIAESEEFVGKVDSKKDEATLVILRGPGAQTAGGLTVGQAEVSGAGVTVLLDRPGLAAYIPRNGAPPIGPFAISDKALSQVQDELAPEVARAAKGGGLLEKLIPAVVGAVAIGAILSGDDEAPVRTQPAQDANGIPGTANNQNGTGN